MAGPKAAVLWPDGGYGTPRRSWHDARLPSIAAELENAPQQSSSLPVTWTTPRSSWGLLEPRQPHSARLATRRHHESRGGAPGATVGVQSSDRSRRTFAGGPPGTPSSASTREGVVGRAPRPPDPAPPWWLQVCPRVAAVDGGWRLAVDGLRYVGGGAAHLARMSGRYMQCAPYFVCVACPNEVLEAHPAATRTTGSTRPARCASCC